MKKYLILLLLLYPILCFATVDTLCVNHTTNELYWFEVESDYFGIGWHCLGNDGDDTYYLEKGYAHTSFPYKIELFIFIISIVVIITGILVYDKMKRAADSSGNIP
ncbi:MAG: hypothetical protein GY754_10880 [bacterium]|nr:hypothetical protein [bacterium]